MIKPGGEQKWDISTDEKMFKNKSLVAAQGQAS
jgi:hypothetical protein